MAVTERVHNERFRDFTNDVSPITFKVDDDVFEAPSIISIPAMQDLVDVGGAIKIEGDLTAKVELILKVFDIILLDESAQRIRERFHSKVRPIGLQQLIDIMHWLLEVYGIRPTGPSSSSSSGSDDEIDGTTSTAGAPSVE